MAMEGEPILKKTLVTMAAIVGACAAASHDPPTAGNRGRGQRQRRQAERPPGHSGAAKRGGGRGHVGGQAEHRERYRRRRGQDTARGGAGREGAGGYDELAAVR